MALPRRTPVAAYAAAMAGEQRGCERIEMQRMAPTAAFGRPIASSRREGIGWAAMDAALRNSEQPRKTGCWAFRCGARSQWVDRHSHCAGGTELPRKGVREGSHDTA